MASPNYAARGYKDIKVYLDGAVAVVTLNRAKQRNTYVHSLVVEIVDVFDLLDRDDRVRVVVFTAEHTAPAYCSGADISSSWDTLFGKEEDKEGPHVLVCPAAHRDSGGIVTMAIFRCRKITIAAVNGHAVGIGVTGLQLPFDFRFVWAGAKLALPFVRRGIAAEATSGYLLPRLIGHAKATALLLTGGTFMPDSPYLQGLYHQVLPTREEVFPAALAFAKELAANTSQTAVAVTKALLWRGGDTIEAHHLIDSRAISELARARDGNEGTRAFMERRAANFQDTLGENMGNWMPWWSEIETKYRRAKL
ncbi:peroxisomal enoyl-CoA-hydratase [Auriscalpium vulgare]|uniref:Peroxisomal enoyl-CoA-hydratase n=1 Tax=Auriscalpium vulgare TaxID=40419 RepID=A0ACB8S8N0_9AGAM|nr:peroxisomal enoyl-CoA-hydratase [Auriscalpium vulgare]